MEEQQLPAWQVHRGYWRGGLRENTMQAFYAAKRLGAQMIELDVRLSRDGVPVVFHDESLDRIFHIKQKVSAMKWQDLNSLNIFSLADVVKSENVPKYLNVELKSTGIWPNRLVKNTAKVLKTSRKKKFLISSFNPLCLYWSQRYMPDYPRALILGDGEVVLSWKMKKIMAWSKPHYLNVEQNLLLVEETRNEIIKWGLPVCVWTVNDTDQAKFFMERGAVSIISDEPPPPEMR